MIEPTENENNLNLKNQAAFDKLDTDRSSEMRFRKFMKIANGFFVLFLLIITIITALALFKVLTLSLPLLAGLLGIAFLFGFGSFFVSTYFTHQFSMIPSTVILISLAICALLILSLLGFLPVGLGVIGSVICLVGFGMTLIGACYRAYRAYRDEKIEERLNWVMQHGFHNQAVLDEAILMSKQYSISEQLMFFRDLMVASHIVDEALRNSLQTEIDQYRNEFLENLKFPLTPDEDPESLFAIFEWIENGKVFFRSDHSYKEIWFDTSDKEDLNVFINKTRLEKNPSQEMFLLNLFFKLIQAAKAPCKDVAFQEKVAELYAYNIANFFTLAFEDPIYPKDRTQIIAHLSEMVISMGSIGIDAVKNNKKMQALLQNTQNNGQNILQSKNLLSFWLTLIKSSNVEPKINTAKAYFLDRYVPIVQRVLFLDRHNTEPGFVHFYKNNLESLAGLIEEMPNDIFQQFVDRLFSTEALNSNETSCLNITPPRKNLENFLLQLSNHFKKQNLRSESFEKYMVMFLQDRLLDTDYKPSVQSSTFSELCTNHADSLLKDKPLLETAKIKFLECFGSGEKLQHPDNLLTPLVKWVTLFSCPISDEKQTPQEVRSFRAASNLAIHLFTDTPSSKKSLSSAFEALGEHHDSAWVKDLLGTTLLKRLKQLGEEKNTGTEKRNIDVLVDSIRSISDGYVYQPSENHSPEKARTCNQLRLVITTLFDFHVYSALRGHVGIKNDSNKFSALLETWKNLLPPTASNEERFAFLSNQPLFNSLNDYIENPNSQTAPSLEPLFSGFIEMLNTQPPLEEKADAKTNLSPNDPSALIPLRMATLRGALLRKRIEAAAATTTREAERAAREAFDTQQRAIVEERKINLEAVKTRARQLPQRFSDAYQGTLNERIRDHQLLLAQADMGVVIGGMIQHEQIVPELIQYALPPLLQKLSIEMQANRLDSDRKIERSALFNVLDYYFEECLKKITTIESISPEEFMAMTETFEVFFKQRNRYPAIETYLTKLVDTFVNVINRSSSNDQSLPDASTYTRILLVQIKLWLVQQPVTVNGRPSIDLDKFLPLFHQLKSLSSDDWLQRLLADDVIFSEFQRVKLASKQNSLFGDFSHHITNHLFADVSDNGLSELALSRLSSLRNNQNTDVLSTKNYQANQRSERRRLPYLVLKNAVQIACLEAESKHSHPVLSQIDQCVDFYFFEHKALFRNTKKPDMIHTKDQRLEEFMLSVPTDKLNEVRTDFVNRIFAYLERQFSPPNNKALRHIKNSWFESALELIGAIEESTIDEDAIKISLAQAFDALSATIRTPARLHEWHLLQAPVTHFKDEIATALTSSFPNVGYEYCMAHINKVIQENHQGTFGLLEFIKNISDQGNLQHSADFIEFAKPFISVTPNRITPYQIDATYVQSFIRAIQTLRTSENQVKTEFSVSETANRQEAKQPMSFNVGRPEEKPRVYSQFAVEHQPQFESALALLEDKKNAQKVAHLFWHDPEDTVDFIADTLTDSIANQLYQDFGVADDSKSASHLLRRVYDEKSADARTLKRSAIRESIRECIHPKILATVQALSRTSGFPKKSYQNKQQFVDAVGTYIQNNTTDLAPAALAEEINHQLTYTHLLGKTDTSGIRARMGNAHQFPNSDWLAMRASFQWKNAPSFRQNITTQWNRATTETKEACTRLFQNIAFLDETVADKGPMALLLLAARRAEEGLENAETAIWNMLEQDIQTNLQALFCSEEKAPLPRTAHEEKHLRTGGRFQVGTDALEKSIQHAVIPAKLTSIGHQWLNDAEYSTKFSVGRMFDNDQAKTNRTSGGLSRQSIVLWVSKSLGVPYSTQPGRIGDEQLDKLLGWLEKETYLNADSLSYPSDKSSDSPLIDYLNRGDEKTSPQLTAFKKSIMLEVSKRTRIKTRTPTSTNSILFSFSDKVSEKCQTFTEQPFNLKLGNARKMAAIHEFFVQYQVLFQANGQVSADQLNQLKADLYLDWRNHKSSYQEGLWWSLSSEYTITIQQMFSEENARLLQSNSAQQANRELKRFEEDLTARFQSSENSASSDDELSTSSSFASDLSESSASSSFSSISDEASEVSEVKTPPPPLPKISRLFCQQQTATQQEMKAIQRNLQNASSEQVLKALFLHVVLRYIETPPNQLPDFDENVSLSQLINNFFAKKETKHSSNTAKFSAFKALYHEAMGMIDDHETIQHFCDQFSQRYDDLSTRTDSSGQKLAKQAVKIGDDNNEHRQAKVVAVALLSAAISHFLGKNPNAHDVPPALAQLLANHLDAKPDLYRRTNGSGLGVFGAYVHTAQGKNASRRSVNLMNSNPGNTNT